MQKNIINSKRGRNGRICICQMINNEHQYIEEWIEYYINIGISKFYLIEDWNSDSHSEILKKYGDIIELYQLTEIINDEERAMLISGNLRQRIVWHIWHRLWYDLYDYMAFIDVDEFIESDKLNLELLLDEAEEYPIICLHWKNMTANGHIYHPNNGKKIFFNKYL